MAHPSPGPYRLHQHSPVIILDRNGKEIGRTSSVGSRAEREANARLFAASFSYHLAAYHLALPCVEHSAYSSSSAINAAVNDLMSIRQGVEGR